MNKKIFASLLLTVFALGFTGCSEEQSSNSKAETKETKASVLVTEVENMDDETEIIKTTPQNPNNVVTEIDNNDYSIGLLLTGWNTSISSISEIDPSLDYVLEINKPTFIVRYICWSICTTYSIYVARIDTHRTALN